MDTRCACLKTLQLKIEMEGVPMKDEMTFCKGDGPSLEFGSGNQRDGHYYSSGCKIHADRTYELDHAFHCPYKPLQERHQMVLNGQLAFKDHLHCTLNHLQT